MAVCTELCRLLGAVTLAMTILAAEVAGAIKGSRSLGIASAGIISAGAAAAKVGVVVVLTIAGVPLVGGSSLVVTGVPLAASTDLLATGVPLVRVTFGSGRLATAPCIITPRWHSVALDLKLGKSIYSEGGGGEGQVSDRRAWLQVALNVNDRSGGRVRRR